MSKPKKNRRFNRFNDAFVKYILSNKLLLINLLNAIFAEYRPPCVKGDITDVTYGDRELIAFHSNEKVGRLDIFATTSEGQIIDIEVQCRVDNALLARDLFYFSRIYATQKIEGKEYDQAKPVIIINLLKENHFHDRDDYIRSYSMRDDKTYELMKDNKIFFICIEARKCVKLGDKDKNHLIRWMHFFSNISQKNDAELAEKDEVIKLLLEAEKMFKRNDNNMKEYTALEEMQDELEWEKQKSKKEIKAREQEHKKEMKAREQEYKKEMKAREQEYKKEMRERKERELNSKIESVKKMQADGFTLDAIKKYINITDRQLAKAGLC